MASDSQTHMAAPAATAMVTVNPGYNDTGYNDTLSVFDLNYPYGYLPTYNIGIYRYKYGLLQCGESKVPAVSHRQPTFPARTTLLASSKLPFTPTLLAPRHTTFIYT